MFHNILFHRNSAVFLSAFFLVRIFGFYTRDLLFVQSSVTLLAILIFAYITWQSREKGLFLVAAELLLFGSGQFLQLFDISLRTWLLMTFFMVFFCKEIKQWRQYWQGKQIDYLLLAILSYTGFAALQGYLLGNQFSAIISDTIPFVYLLLFFPLRYSLEQKRLDRFKDDTFRLIASFLIGQFLFTFLIFILFSLEFNILQDPFYKWLRDVAAAKITFLGNGFWRVVFPEHLLMIPLFAGITILFVRNKQQTTKNKRNLNLALILILTLFILNFSRAYLLALVAIVIISLYKTTVKNWLFFVTKTILLFFFLFFSINFIASSGTSFGLDHLGLRTASFVAPETELSTATRMTLLFPILEKITERPYLGHGLGSTVNFIDPLTNTIKNTPQFDWGYFELWVEFGIYGGFIFMLLILFLLSRSFKDIHQGSSSSFVLSQTIFLGLIGLCMAMLFGPVLFHVFGIVIILIYISLSSLYSKS